jgi:hypothetical protein
MGALSECTVLSAPDYTRPQHTQEHTKADRRSLRPTSQSLLRPLQRYRDGGRSGGPSLHARFQVASLVSQWELAVPSKSQQTKIMIPRAKRKIMTKPGELEWPPPEGSI